MKQVLILAAVLTIVSCEPPGQRSARSLAIPPDQVKNFSVLYSHNCAACHGPNGRGGVSVELANPVYLTIAPDAAIRRVVSQGRPGTVMPAFAQQYGGMLTDAQVDAIVTGIRTDWTKPGVAALAGVPSYEQQADGDPKRGEAVYNANCSICHGGSGRKGPAGPIVDASFLALVSSQYLRTTIIAGIPTLGMPDWRGHPKPLTDADVTDVVAWLTAQRPQMYLTDLLLSRGIQ